MSSPRTFPTKPESITFGMIDHSGENTGTTLYADIATTSDDDLTFFGDGVDPYQVLKVALAAITKLNFTRTILGITVDDAPPTLPSAADAQREWYIKFTYVDLTTNRLYNFTVPAPEDAVVQSNTDEVDLGNVLIAAFVAAVELYCTSPVGNPIEIRSARIGGRNS